MPESLDYAACNGAHQGSTLASRRLSALSRTYSGEAIRRPGIGGQADGFGGPDPLKDLRSLPEVSFGLVYAAYGHMAGAEASRRS